MTDGLTRLSAAARFDAVKTLPEDWPFWCNPDYRQVEKEIKSAERLMPDGSRKAVSFKKDGKNIILNTPAYTLDPVILFLK